MSQFIKIVARFSCWANRVSYLVEKVDFGWQGHYSIDDLSWNLPSNSGADDIGCNGCIRIWQKVCLSHSEDGFKFENVKFVHIKVQGCRNMWGKGAATTPIFSIKVVKTNICNIPSPLKFGTWKVLNMVFVLWMVLPLHFFPRKVLGQEPFGSIASGLRLQPARHA